MTGMKPKLQNCEMAKINVTIQYNTMLYPQNKEHCIVLYCNINFCHFTILQFDPLNKKSEKKRPACDILELFNKNIKVMEEEKKYY